jgi:hypothetical protein
LPRLVHTAGGVQAIVAGREETFAAALDATGRAAAWSRPVQRGALRVADLYQVPGSAPARGRIVSLAEGWGYRIGLGQHTTAGIVTTGRAATRHLPPALATALAIPDGVGTFCGRRPAFPQWAVNPVQGRRLAIGDAALACDPVAGQGVRFALASALAATAVVVSWQHRTGQEESPANYYTNLVGAARNRHRGFLTDFYGPAAAEERQEALPRVLCFTGRTFPGELHVEGLVVPGTVLELPGGGWARWLGTFDLLLMRELAPQPTPLALLSQRLVGLGVRAEAVDPLLRWCVRQQVLGIPPD